MAPSNSYVTVPLLDVAIGEKLPVQIYLYLDHRFILFRDFEDVIDTQAFDRLMLRKVEHIFVREEDRPKFKAWAKGFDEQVEIDLEEKKKSPHYAAMTKLRDEVNREALDIFQTEQPNKLIAAALKAAKSLVDQFMGVPYAIKPITLLQSSAKGVSDHSVNVSVLSVYLATQMGYSNQTILQNLGAGALLHDIGKLKVEVLESDTPTMIEEKMKKHPELGTKLLDELGAAVPKEVKFIVEQHHEFMDGTGYPQKVRGNSIYDLARLVCIANIFDEWVANESGPLAQRQQKVLERMHKEMSQKFDPIKFEKVIKILRSGV